MQTELQYRLARSDRHSSYNSQRQSPRPRPTSRNVSPRSIRSDCARSRPCFAGKIRRMLGSGSATRLSSIWLAQKRLSISCQRSLTSLDPLSTFRGQFQCFQAVQPFGIAPITITDERLNQAIQDAGDWFAKNNRGRKLFMTPRFSGKQIQMSIRRGDPFSRKSTIDDDGMDTITFREARKDFMMFDMNEEILMLNSSLKKM